MNSVVFHLDCELRIRRVVDAATADKVEPFQTKMTHFVTMGKVVACLFLYLSRTLNE